MFFPLCRQNTFYYFFIALRNKLNTELLHTYAIHTKAESVYMLLAPMLLAHLTDLGSPLGSVGIAGGPAELQQASELLEAARLVSPKIETGTQDLHSLGSALARIDVF